MDPRHDLSVDQQIEAPLNDAHFKRLVEDLQATTSNGAGWNPIPEGYGARARELGVRDEPATDDPVCFERVYLRPGEAQPAQELFVVLSEQWRVPLVQSFGTSGELHRKGAVARAPDHRMNHILEEVAVRELRKVGLTVGLYDLSDGDSDLPQAIHDVVCRPVAAPVLQVGVDSVVLPHASRHRPELRLADALVIRTPEYAAALPGSLENLLEWLIGDDHPRSVYRKPVAWINASTRGATDTHDSLRKVLGYAHATILDDVSAEIPAASSLIGSDGEIHDQGARAQIAHVMDRLRDSLGRGTRE